MVQSLMTQTEELGCAAIEQVAVRRSSIGLWIDGRGGIAGQTVVLQSHRQIGGAHPEGQAVVRVTGIEVHAETAAGRIEAGSIHPQLPRKAQRLRERRLGIHAQERKRRARGSSHLLYLTQAGAQLEAGRSPREHGSGQKETDSGQHGEPKHGKSLCAERRPRAAETRWEHLSLPFEVRTGPASIAQARPQRGRALPTPEVREGGRITRRCAPEPSCSSPWPFPAPGEREAWRRPPRNS